MLGSTVPTIGGLDKAFYWGDLWNCQAVQFYLTLSRKWQVDEIKKENISLFKNTWKESKVKEVVAHIPYLVNLVSENIEVKEKSIERMTKEIERANILGVKYLVLHPGSIGKQNKEKAIEILKESFDKVFKKVKPENTKILIETMAGQGSYLGASFKEVAEILSILNNDNYFGVCLDSAHIFASGYDIRDKEAYEKTFKEFEKNLSIKRINAIHLNDSKAELGSNKDRHEHIGKGKIGIEFFRLLVNDKRFISIPKILETPETDTMSEINLKILRGLIK